MSELVAKTCPLATQEVVSRLNGAAKAIKEGRRAPDLGQAVQEALVVVSWAHAAHMARQLEAVSRQLEVTSDGHYILVLNVADGPPAVQLHANGGKPGLGHERLQGRD